MRALLVAVLLFGCLLAGAVDQLAPETPTAASTDPPAPRSIVHPPTWPAVVDAFVEERIAEGVFPGAVVVVGTTEAVLLQRAWGQRSIAPAEPMTVDTVFDLASVTKTVAGTSAVLKLKERGALTLDDRVADHLPGFGTRHPSLTVEHLLNHSAGLRGGWQIYKDKRRGRRPSPDRCLRHIKRRDPYFPPGEQTRYSDAGYLVLGRVVEAVAGRRLDRLLEREVFGPLGMSDTTYALTRRQTRRTAPARAPGEGARGVVHDPITVLASGRGHRPAHAGLFSTAGDLGRYARMLLRGGVGDDGRRVFAPATLDFNATSFGWCAGWVDESVAGDCSRLSKEGFTGTYVFIDRVRGWYLVYLSNRTHVMDDDDVYAPDFSGLRRLVADGLEAAQALPAAVSAGR